MRNLEEIAIIIKDKDHEPLILRLNELNKIMLIYPLKF